MPRTARSTSRKRRETTATGQTKPKRSMQHTNVPNQTRATTTMTTQTDSNTLLPDHDDSFVTPPALDPMYGYVENVNQGYYVDNNATQCFGNYSAQGPTITDPNIYGQEFGATHSYGPPPPPPQHFTQGTNLSYTPANPTSAVFGPPPPSSQYFTQGANLVAPTSSVYGPPPPAPLGPPTPLVISQGQGANPVAPAGTVFQPPAQTPMLHGANKDAPASGPFEVWVIGSSIFRDAFYYVKENQGLNLGLDVKIIWDFRPGMKVQHLPKEIQQLSLKYQKYPDLLIIHCGGNDIGQTPLSEAELLAIHTLNDIHQLCTYNGIRIKIVWSQILPRLCYRGERNHVKLNKARKRFNTPLQSYCKSVGGAYIRHQDIVEAQPFFRDMVHLSDFGNEIFTNNLKEGIVAILQYNRDCYP